jgi:outer membrane immunogenic protein
MRTSSSRVTGGLFGFAVLAGFASAALAQEGDARPGWDGYFGQITLGGRFGTSRQNFSNGNSTGDYSVNGVIGGVGFGYARQFGRFVLGAEADMSASSSDGRAHRPNPTYNYETENNWLGTVQSRAGYDFGGAFLPFVTAGLATGDIRFHTFRLNGAGPVGDYSKVNLGWTVGAGLETAIASTRWGIRADYRYVKFDDANGIGSTGNPISTSFDEHILRVGILYRIN